MALQIACRSFVAWITANRLPVALGTKTLEDLDCLPINIFDVDVWAEVGVDSRSPVLLFLGFIVQ